MSIDAKIESGILVISIFGRFDSGVCEQFSEATDLVDSCVQKAVIDMTETDYMDSAALGMLLLLSDMFGYDRTKVTIKASHPDVRKVLEIAHFERIFSLS